MEFNDFINEIKEQTKNYTELEKVRFVYLKLGSIMGFDINFSFGNSKTRSNIYNSCSPKVESLNEYYREKTAICRSLSYMLRYILRELNIDCIMEYVSKDRRIKHTYNVVYLNDGRELTLDLQEDLEYIQFRCETKHFTGITRDELKKIDKKIGYISDKEYYLNEYLTFMKMYLSYFSSLSDKVEFILNNLDYYNLDKNYVEFRWFYIKKLLCFLNNESRRLHFVDCYKNINGKIINYLIVAVDLTKEGTYFLISNEEREIKKYTRLEFINIMPELNFRGEDKSLKLNLKK